MKDLFVKIAEVFDNQKDLFINKGLSPIGFVGLYTGQAEMPDAGGCMCPALFIEYETDWKTGNNRLKKGMLSLRVHVIIPASTNGLPEQESDELNKLVYYRLIGEIMERIETESISPLSLVREEAAHTACFHYQILRFSAVIYKHKQENSVIKNILPEISLDRE